MIESLAVKIATRMKNINPDETASIEVMAFSLGILLNGISIVALTLLIGYFWGVFAGTLLALSSFAILRFFSGGIHLPTSEWCIAISTSIMVLIPKLPIPEKYIILVTAINLILVLIYAPSRIEKQSRIPAKYYPLLKIVSALIVASAYVFHSGVMAMTFLIQCLLLIRFSTKK